MKRLILFLFLISTPAIAGTAFFQHEDADGGGFWKTCYYDYLGETVAISIEITEICPLTINWPRD